MNQLENFQKIFKNKNLTGFIVTNPVNIFYLTGFKGVSPLERESILVFNPRPTLITAKLYQQEARLAQSRLAKRLASKNLKIKIVQGRNEMFKTAQKLLKDGLPTEALRSESSGSKTLAKVGFEEENLTYAEFKQWKKALSHAKFIPQKDQVETIRIAKTDEELKKIAKAQAISQKSFEILVKTIKSGQKEAEIAEKLTRIIKNLGGQGHAFEPIVASGANAALPHYVTGKRKIKKGEVLLLDFGAKYQEYCADLSRTIFIGRAKNAHLNIYDHVQKAQKQALLKIISGVKASEPYHTVNEHFKKHKLDKYFIHGLGHGIGLEVHERPYLRPTIDEELGEKMVFSVEPGLYFPQWGGVRIEDLVVIKDGKAKVLGKLAEFIQIN